MELMQLMSRWKLAETICVVRVLLAFPQDSNIDTSLDEEVSHATQEETTIWKLTSCTPLEHHRGNKIIMTELLGELETLSEIWCETSLKS